MFQRLCRSAFSPEAPCQRSPFPAPVRSIKSAKKQHVRVSVCKARERHANPQGDAPDRFFVSLTFRSSKWARSTALFFDLSASSASVHNDSSMVISVAGEADAIGATALPSAATALEALAEAAASGSPSAAALGTPSGGCGTAPVTAPPLRIFPGWFPMTDSRVWQRQSASFVFLRHRGQTIPLLKQTLDPTLASTTCTGREKCFNVNRDCGADSCLTGGHCVPSHWLPAPENAASCANQSHNMCIAHSNVNSTIQSPRKPPRPSHSITASKCDTDTRVRCPGRLAGCPLATRSLSPAQLSWIWLGREAAWQRAPPS